VTATSVLDALTSANFKNGVGSSDLYISLYSVGSPQYNDFVANHPTMLGMTIGQDFNNPSIMADSQMGGHNIYVRPNSISKNSVFYDAGFLTHEVFHNLGFTDDQIKSALGLTDADCGSATACITGRIQ